LVSGGDDDQVLIHCQGGCADHEIMSALDLQVKLLDAGHESPLTLEILAAHKKLPADYLKNCGVHDIKGGVGFTYWCSVAVPMS